MNILKWHNFPVLNSCCTTKPEEDIFYNLCVDIDEETGLVYQTNTPPQDIIYAMSRNSAIGKVWLNHNNEFYNFIFRNEIKSQNICEIGSGAGNLAQKISQNYKIDCYEPNPAFKENKNLTIKKEFFRNKLHKKYDVIILSHVLEHMPELEKFLLCLRENLTESGKIFLSFPNLDASLTNEHFPIFNNEHLSYFSQQSTERVLNKNGFANCIYHFHKDHSIFVEASKSNNFSFEKINQSEVELIKYRVDQYNNKINDKIKTLEDKLKGIEKFHLFGCHAMSGILIYLSKCLQQEKIISILDNDNLKHNLRLYGTNLYCRPAIKSESNYVVLNGGCYHEEIKEQLVYNGYKVIEWR